MGQAEVVVVLAVAGGAEGGERCLHSSRHLSAPTGYNGALSQRAAVQQRSARQAWPAKAGREPGNAFGIPSLGMRDKMTQRASATESGRLQLRATAAAADCTGLAGVSSREWCSDVLAPAYLGSRNNH